MLTKDMILCHKRGLLKSAYSTIAFAWCSFGQTLYQRSGHDIKNK